MKPTQARPATPTPVADDLHATATQVQARAAVDYAQAQAATRTKQQQGGPGTRQGILPAGGAR